MNFTCPICLTVPNGNICMIDCGHSYCEHCLQTWLQSQVQEECPVCRSIVHKLVRNYGLEEAVEQAVNASSRSTQTQPVLNKFQSVCADILQWCTGDIDATALAKTYACVRATDLDWVFMAIVHVVDIVPAQDASVWKAMPQTRSHAMPMPQTMPQAMSQAMQVLEFLLKSYKTCVLRLCVNDRFVALAQLAPLLIRVFRQVPVHHALGLDEVACVHIKLLCHAASLTTCETNVYLSAPLVKQLKDLTLLFGDVSSHSLATLSKHLCINVVCCNVLHDLESMTMLNAHTCHLVPSSNWSEQVVTLVSAVILHCDTDNDPYFYGVDSACKLISLHIQHIHPSTKLLVALIQNNSLQKLATVLNLRTRTVFSPSHVRHIISVLCYLYASYHQLGAQHERMRLQKRVVEAGAIVACSFDDIMCVMRQVLTSHASTTRVGLLCLKSVWLVARMQHHRTRITRDHRECVYNMACQHMDDPSFAMLASEVVVHVSDLLDLVETVRFGNLLSAVMMRNTCSSIVVQHCMRALKDTSIQYERLCETSPLSLHMQTKRMYCDPCDGSGVFACATRNETQLTTQSTTERTWGWVLCGDVCAPQMRMLMDVFLTHDGLSADLEEQCLIVINARRLHVFYPCLLLHVMRRCCARKRLHRSRRNDLHLDRLAAKLLFAPNALPHSLHLGACQWLIETIVLLSGLPTTLYYGVDTECSPYESHLCLHRNTDTLRLIVQEAFYGMRSAADTTACYQFSFSHPSIKRLAQVLAHFIMTPVFGKKIVPMHNTKRLAYEFIIFLSRHIPTGVFHKLVLQQLCSRRVEVQRVSNLQILPDTFRNMIDEEHEYLDALGVVGQCPLSKVNPPAGANRGFAHGAVCQTPCAIVACTHVHAGLEHACASVGATHNA